MIWLQRMIGMSKISFQATILLLEQASVVYTLVLFRRCNAKISLEKTSNAVICPAVLLL